MLLWKLGSDLAPGSKGLLGVTASSLSQDAGWQDQGSPHPPGSQTLPPSLGSFSKGSHQGPWSSLQIPSLWGRSGAAPLERDKFLPSGAPKAAGNLGSVVGWAEGQMCLPWEEGTGVRMRSVSSWELRA